MTGNQATSPTPAPLFARAAESAAPGDPIRVVRLDDRIEEYVAGEHLRPGDELSVDDRTGRLIRRTIVAPLSEPNVPHEPSRQQVLGALDDIPVPTSVNPASIAAAQAAAGHVGSQRRQALAAFHDAGSRGLTDDELAVALDLVPNRVATRRKELQDADLVTPAGWTRPTRSNVDAAVHRITPLGTIAAQPQENRP